MKRVVVVGGGISGLVTAYRLTRTQNGDEPPEVIVVERSGRVGGKIHTIDLLGFPAEAGADSFVVRKPWAVDLCRELGLGGELVRPGAEGAHVWTRARLVPFPDRTAFGIPSTVRALLAWQGLSPGARLRALADVYRKPSSGDEDQSLGSLIRRRLGPEALRVLVGPLLAGIHAGDPDRLSLLATFPELRAWERGHESLVRGARAALKAAPSAGGEPLFASVWDGLSGLVQVLEEAIGTDRVWLGTPATHVGASPSGLEVLAGERPLQADAVVVTAPAGEAAAVLGSVNPSVAAELGTIPYVSTAVVFLVYPHGTVPEGTGFVAPLGERTITACTWLSSKWPRPEHAGRLVMRCFVGKAGAEEALSLSDEALATVVAGEIREALSPQADPELTKVVRWPRAMPQYEVGHLDRMRRIEEALSATPGLFLTGSAYRGVGIADCVRQANETAQRVLVYLRERKEPSVEKDRRETISWKT